MKSRKVRRVQAAASEARAAQGEEKVIMGEAPDFLVRLVGKTRAKNLCREEPTHRRRD